VGSAGGSCGSPGLSTRDQIVFGFVVGLGLSTAGIAQQSPEPTPLPLQQAVTIALDKNPLRKATLAEIRASSADIKGARSFLLPHLTFTEAATRGNDPVYVFGSRLRQQRFTAADFALNKLNTPLALGNFSTQFGGAWNLFDSFASWRRVTQAKFMNQAASQQLGRSDQEIIFRVISSYYEVLLSGKQLEVSQQAAKTAQSIVDSSQARLDSGLAVESDLLTAKVRLAARRQDVIRADNNLKVARAQLNTAMGVAAESSFQLTEALAERALPTPALEEIESRALANRPDLKRIASEEAAQRQSVAIAKSSFGPKINAFAGWQLDNPTLLAGGGGNNWLGGIEVKFDVFDGGARRAELSHQRALAEKAAAMKQAASDAVRLEVRRAYYDVDSSRQQVEVARAAIAEAGESFRINQDRYGTGLTTITDLLSAEEAARRSQTDYWEAIYRFYTSYANMELASGTLNSQSPVVMP
jgi:outer membrane protein